MPPYTIVWQVLLSMCLLCPCVWCRSIRSFHPLWNSRMHCICMSPDDFQRVYDEVVDVVASPRIHIPTTNTTVLLYSTTWQELFSNTTTPTSTTSNTTTTTSPTISEADQWSDFDTIYIGLGISITVAGFWLYLRWLYLRWLSYTPQERVTVYPMTREDAEPIAHQHRARATPGSTPEPRQTRGPKTLDKIIQ
jgi:hypothetical protein